MLDFLVGVHGNPYLYPFSSNVFVSPLGILPSSGRVDIHNHYFWRNILIELAIFMPLMFAFIPHYRSFVLKHKVLLLLLISLFILGVMVGFSLDRG
jgi:glycopeptide antibiotics resistance protein